MHTYCLSHRCTPNPWLPCPIAWCRILTILSLVQQFSGEPGTTSLCDPSPRYSPFPSSLEVILLPSTSHNMSWIWNPSGNAPKPQPTEEMVPDPGNPNRMVSKKAANQPFLAYVPWLLVPSRVLSRALATTNTNSNKRGCIKPGCNARRSAKKSLREEKRLIRKSETRPLKKKSASSASSSSSSTFCS